MSPFDGTTRNLCWTSPRGLKIFGGLGAKGTRLQWGRAEWLDTYKAENLNHPQLAGWYKGKLVAYNNELVRLTGGSDMVKIYGQFAEGRELVIRAEMEQIGYTKQLLQTWGMLDDDDEEDLIDDFEPEFM